MSTAVIESPKASAAKLLRAREEAIAFIQNQVKRGSEIKAMRIRNGTELDAARTQKLEWTNVATELLKELFDSSAVADECNDWVGKIYPEYAEFGNFVDQFYAEMDHRLKRLKAVIKQIQKVPSETTRTSAPAPASAPAAASAPVAAVAAPASGVVSLPKPQPLATELLKGMLLVCGGDESAKAAVSEFLDSLEADVTLVDEAMAGGPGGLVESLDNARDTSFAVILTSEPPQTREFEVGFLVGRMGLRRVCIIHPQNAQVQSDPRGLTHIVLDNSGGWQLVLARHLKRAGLGVDLNRLC